jgi:uncharacterized LabA/DUF88 family protein
VHDESPARPDAQWPPAGFFVCHPPSLSARGMNSMSNPSGPSELTLPPEVSYATRHRGRPRVCAFVDGQNLYRAALNAYGPTHRTPRYDVLALTEKIAELEELGEVTDVMFYTGIHSTKKPALREFWVKKLAAMGRQVGANGARVHPYARQLQYTREERVREDGTTEEWFAGHEKGIDVKMALDMVRMARTGQHEVCVIFSQDCDFSEAVAEARAIAAEHGRSLEMVCAFPVATAGGARTRGIPGTRHVGVPKVTYESCLDRRSYWPPRPPQVTVPQAPATTAPVVETQLPTTPATETSVDAVPVAKAPAARGVTSIRQLATAPGVQRRAALMDTTVDPRDDAEAMTSPATQLPDTQSTAQSAAVPPARPPVSRVCQ